MKRIPVKQSLANPYLVTPPLPNSFDDEFDSGSPDLLTRGWTILSSAGVVLTRNGDIDPWGAGPPANTYNSTLIGSSIFVQPAPATQVDIMKTITLAAGDTYFANLGGAHVFSAGANGRFEEIGLYGFTAGALDNNNRVYNTVRDDTTAAQFLFIDIARITAGANVGIGRVCLQPFNVRGVHFDSGTTHRHVMLSTGPSAARPVGATSTGTPAAATLVRFAIRYLATYGEGATPLLEIDWIRKKTGNAWLIP